MLWTSPLCPSLPVHNISSPALSLNVHNIYHVFALNRGVGDDFIKTDPAVLRVLSPFLKKFGFELKMIIWKSFEDFMYSRTTLSTIVWKTKVHILIDFGLQN